MNQAPAGRRTPPRGSPRSARWLAAGLLAAALALAAWSEHRNPPRCIAPEPTPAREP